MLYFFYSFWEKIRRLNRLPRQPRRKSQSNVYHCMLRGINKQDIFFDDKDYLEFQNIIRKTKKNYSFRNQRQKSENITNYP